MEVKAPELMAVKDPSALRKKVAVGAAATWSWWTMWGVTALWILKWLAKMLKFESYYMVKFYPLKKKWYFLQLFSYTVMKILTKYYVVRRWWNLSSSDTEIATRTDPCLRGSKMSEGEQMRSCKTENGDNVLQCIF